MPYRDEDEVLRERYRTLEGELSQMKESREVLAGLDAREAQLREEMATLTRAIARTRRRADQPLLANLSVASPCPARWEDMVGDERSRFCGGCKKNVHNISALAAAEAEALLRANSGGLCVRYFQRADGTVMTQDCPDGVRRKKNRKLAVVAAGAFGLAATAFGSVAAFANMGARHAVTGSMAVESGPGTQQQLTTMMGDPAPVEPSSAAPPEDPPAVPVMGEPPLAEPQLHTMGRMAPPHAGRGARGIR
jgi:hypothetical protein